MLRRRVTTSGGGTPPVSVTSVNGQTGVVVLGAADVGAVALPGVTSVNGSTGAVSVTPANIGAATPAPDPEAFRLGLEIVSCPLWAASVDFDATSGLFAAVLVTAMESATIATLGIAVRTAGAAAGGNNELGIYSEAGVQLGLTGDMSVDLTGTGWIEKALGASVNVVAKTRYYLTFLCHFGTPPKIAATPGSVFSAYPAVNGKRLSVFDTGIASSPASFTPSGVSQNNVAYMLGAR